MEEQGRSTQVMLADIDAAACRVRDLEGDLERWQAWAEEEEKSRGAELDAKLRCKDSDSSQRWLQEGFKVSAFGRFA